jgi:tetratricopeptide (TPR) repeat protein
VESRAPLPTYYLIDMPLALRIRVAWDDDIIQDQVFLPPRTVRLGAFGRPEVITPAGPDEPPITFAWRATHYLLTVPQGITATVQLAGEAPLCGPGHTVPQAVTRRLTRETGHIEVGPAAIDFQVLPFEREHPTLQMFARLLIVALLALGASLSYPLMHAPGDSTRTRWGEVKPIGQDEALRLRVHLAPSLQRTSQLATGQGKNLQRQTLAAPRPPMRTRPAPARPALSASAPASPPTQPQDSTHKSPPSPPSPAAEKPASPSQATPSDLPQPLVERGQQAFLAAELRSAIISLSAAEKLAPLDYDNLTWLGLAHYFLGELDAAGARWNQALGLDAQRVEAINNLGGIARRRGDLAGEVAAYEKALALHPGDCHALNSLALARAKQGNINLALQTLTESDQACGGDYAYTYIQRAGILALAGKLDEARGALVQGLSRTDTLIPIKEFEVAADLFLDPAFGALRDDPDFLPLTEKYLPRASAIRTQILASAPTALGTTTALPSP